MNPDKMYFASDTHFGHRAMLKYCKRPGADVDEMDEIVIERWNDKIPADGQVYHLGDFSFRNRVDTEAIIGRLNGRIHLIEGNHDSGMARSTKDLFEWTKPYHELKTIWDGAKHRMVLCHFALRHWNMGHYGTWNLHGHSHGSLPPNGKQLDVGIDTNQLTPYSFYEVAKIMATREAWQPDHHQAKTL